MNDWHPDPETLERFLDDDLSDDESRALQRHLLVCAECEDQLVLLLPNVSLLPPTPKSKPQSKPRPVPSGFTALIAEEIDFFTRQERARRERGEAILLFADLRQRSPDERARLVEQEPRFTSWALADLLLEGSHRAMRESHQESHEWALLALAIAERLDGANDPGGAIRSLKTRAWGYLGNALRLRGDLLGARRCFQKAEQQLRDGWLDPLDEGLLLQFKASLARAQGRPYEAIEFLDEAIAIYRSLNEPHNEGRTLIGKGLALISIQESDEAEACLYQGLARIDIEADRSLAYLGEHNLILCQHTAGRHEEAAAHAAAARRRWAGEIPALDLLRLRWIEGKSLLELGRIDLAGPILQDVHVGLLESEQPLLVVEAALDLAQVYLLEARHAEARELAERTVALARGLGVESELLKALVLFERAARRERLTIAVLRDAKGSLERSAARPSTRASDAATGPTS